MNRDIKFRAWHTEEKKMIEVDSICWDLCGNGSNDNQISGYIDDIWECCIPLDKVELMQYTGINDINGVEIYTGDIVEVDEDPLDNEHPDCFKGVVKLIDGSFIIENEREECALFLFDEVRERKVVGHIFKDEI